MNAKRVSIVVPAKNEAEAIVATLDALPIETLRVRGLDVEVVVLDGASRDGTAGLARRWGARVLRDPGLGKGRAFRGARNRLRGDLVVMIDADGTYAADAIPRLIEPLLKDEADVVMGRRSPRHGAMSGLHKLGNVLLSAEASAIYRQRCRDVCTGLWAFRDDVLQSLPLQSTGFELEVELFGLSKRLGYRIHEVPVDYLPRRGETKLSAMQDGPRIAAWILRCRFAQVTRRAPLPVVEEAGL